mgnify:FL=1
MALIVSLGTHSLRVSSATVAANAGVSDRCLKRHGRWKSAKESYIDDSVEMKLSITKQLHL